MRGWGSSPENFLLPQVSVMTHINKKQKALFLYLRIEVMEEK